MVEILYTGTAFVATGEGYLLTNRHVAIEDILNLVEIGE